MTTVGISPLLIRLSLVSLVVSLFLAALFYFVYKDWKKTAVRFSQSFLILALLVAPISVAYGIQKHGCTVEMLNEDGIYNTLVHYENSPIDQSKEAFVADECDVDNRLYVFYRFNCSDCTIMFNELNTKLNQSDSLKGKKIYWVSSRSNCGKKLVEKYDIKWVPSLYDVDSESYIEIGEAKENLEIDWFDGFIDFLS